MTAITAGRITSAPWTGQCPSWCVIDHGRDIPVDVFHRSEFAWLTPNGDLSGDEGPWELAAHIVTAEVPQDGDGSGLVIETQDGTAGPYIEIGIEHVDEFIRQGKAFLARVQQMRDQLAAIKEGQS